MWVSGDVNINIVYKHVISCRVNVWTDLLTCRFSLQHSHKVGLMNC